MEISVTQSSYCRDAIWVMWILMKFHVTASLFTLIEIWLFIIKHRNIDKQIIYICDISSIVYNILCTDKNKGIHIYLFYVQHFFAFRYVIWSPIFLQAEFERILSCKYHRFMEIFTFLRIFFYTKQSFKNSTLI